MPQAGNQEPGGWDEGGTTGRCNLLVIILVLWLSGGFVDDHYILSEQTV